MSTAITELSPTQVCARLGITSTTLYTWLKAGTAPPSYLLGGRRRFSEADLELWLAERRQVTA
jgi:excisionase family DNA binding protein